MRQMHMYTAYPKFNDIVEDLSKDELIQLINIAIDEDTDIGIVIDEYIVENYEGWLEPDYDRAYDEYRDREILGIG